MEIKADYPPCLPCPAPHAKMVSPRQLVTDKACAVKRGVLDLQGLLARLEDRTLRMMLWSLGPYTLTLSDPITDITAHTLTTGSNSSNKNKNKNKNSNNLRLLQMTPGSATDDTWVWYR